MNTDMITAEQVPSPIISLIGPCKTLRYPRQGYNSQVAFVETDRGRFVVKRYRGCRCQQAVREDKVLSALAVTRLPVPRLLQHVETATSKGPEHWLVTEYLSGETLWSFRGRETNSVLRIAVMRACGEIVSAIHSTTPPKVLDDGFLPWNSALALTETNIGLAVRDETLETLAHIREYLPPPVRHGLIHGDLNMRNILVDGTVVTGVVDWSWGSIGDPRYDVVTLLRLRQMHTVSKPEFDAFYKGYGCTPMSEREWQYFGALCALA